MGDDSIDDVSGEVKGVVTLEGELSELLLLVVWLPALEAALEVVDDLLLGNMSGALYESMFVVEINSSGAEIFCCRRVPDGKECLVVKLLFGRSTATSEGFLPRLVVNARERDVDIFADFSDYGLNSAADLDI